MKKPGNGWQKGRRVSWHGISPCRKPISSADQQEDDGRLKLIKKDKVALENLFSKIRYLFNHYEEQGEQQKKQAFEALKEDYEEKIRRRFSSRWEQGWRRKSMSKSSRSSSRSGRDSRINWRASTPGIERIHTGTDGDGLIAVTES
jgi:predicted secreted protein